VSNAGSSGRFDLVVVGLGAMGSAALYHAAKDGLRVLGIDRYDPPHTFGSSHAETRITRLAVGEGEQYLPFVARSHEIWRDLERQTGWELLYQPGGYVITPASPTEDERWGGFVHRTADVAQLAGVDFELRTPEEVSAHLPPMVLDGSESIGFEPSGGIVMCERAITIQLRLAEAAGAQVLRNTVVHRVIPHSSGHVVIEAGSSVYEAEKVIVATGAWLNELAPREHSDALTVTRQVVFWFDVDDPEVFSATHFPFVLWAGQTIADYSAVFPMPARGRPGLKVLGEQFHETTTAESVDRTVRQGEADEFYERLVAPRLRGVRSTIVDTAVCLYTSTVDDHFLIGFHPESSQILLASPCSGHGFKHSTALGEAMIAKMFGTEVGLDLSAFARKPAP